MSFTLLAFLLIQTTVNLAYREEITPLSLLSAGVLALFTLPAFFWMYRLLKPRE
jgi:hypothetical protein